MSYISLYLQLTGMNASDVGVLLIQILSLSSLENNWKVSDFQNYKFSLRNQLHLKMFF